MSYDFTLSTMIPAPPKAVYDAWLDSRMHSEMTGGKAVQSRKLDASVSAWDGYITGKNLELKPSKIIIQSWRTAKFTDKDDDSVIMVNLQPVKGSTLLTLTHSNVPDGHTSYEKGGCQSSYFAPMQKYFDKLIKPAPKKAIAKKSVAKTAPAKKAKPAKRAKAKKPAPRRIAKKTPARKKARRR